MIETQLERLNANIERLIAVFGNGTAAPVSAPQVATLSKKSNTEAKASTEIASATTDTPITVHEVQAALVALASKTGRGPAAEILSAFGATRVGQLAEKDFAAVMAKIKEATAE